MCPRPISRYVDLKAFALDSITIFFFGVVEGRPTLPRVLARQNFLYIHGGTQLGSGAGSTLLPIAFAHLSFAGSLRSRKLSSALGTVKRGSFLRRSLFIGHPHVLHL